MNNAEDQAYKIVSNQELDKWCRANWDNIPAEKRRLCINHLKMQIPMEILRNWKTHSYGDQFHFSGGMAVRNTLREVMKDSELPAVPYEHAGGEAFSNWDDYYTGCLAELLEGI